eukprot:s1747_g2.t1
MFACQRGHVEVARLLLEAGAEKDCRNHDSKTALRFACQWGQLDVARWLLEAGADQECRDHDGTTALMFACQADRLGVARLLLEAGAERDCGNHDGTTALMFACQQGRWGVARLLLEAGVDKDCWNHYGTTALMFACQRGHVEVARLLLEAGADKDCWDDDGTTALMFACQWEVAVGFPTALLFARRNGYLEVARLLLEAGAEKDCWNHDGTTALIFACQRGHVEVARLLLEAGAKKGCWNRDGMTALQQASCNGHLEVFDKVIGIFAKQRNPMKVEEWLLNAGQSGWTPQQAAFEAVVKLYAEVDAMKAEEWLRRSQETEYRLPDTCYVPVVLGFVRAGNPDKAEDVLAMMKANGYMADEAALQEVINLHAEGGNASRAEHLLEIFGSSSGNLDDLRLGIIDASLRAGDVDVAERQVLSLQDPEAGRTMEVAKLLAARGETPRAKTVLEQQCRAAGGDVPPEVCALLLSVAAALSDAPSVEAAAQMLLQTGPLSELQVATLRDAVGDQRAEVVLRDAAAAAIPAMTAPSKGPINGRPAAMARVGRLTLFAAIFVAFAALLGFKAFVPAIPTSRLQRRCPALVLGHTPKTVQAPRSTSLPRPALPTLLAAGGAAALLLRQVVQRLGSNDSALRDLISKHTNILIVDDFTNSDSVESPVLPEPRCRANSADELHWYVAPNGDGLPPVRWILKKPSALQRVLLEGGLGFAESYMDGDWDTDDLERLVFEMLKLENVRSELGWRVMPLLSMIFWGALKWKILPGNSLKGAQSNIANTYDVLNSPKLYEIMPLGEPGSRDVDHQPPGVVAMAASGSNGAPSSSGGYNSTQTATEVESQPSSSSNGPLHLVLEPRPQHNVTWDASVVDNEHMNKKKSKKCRAPDG